MMYALWRRGGIVEYYVSSESGRMIVLWDQAYYVPGLQKYLRIILSQGIHTSLGYKGTLIAHWQYEHDRYTELNLEEKNAGCRKAETLDRLYIKYEPNNNPPNPKYIIPNKK